MRTLIETLLAESSMAVFKRQHPFYSEMNLIADSKSGGRQRVIVGTGRFEIPGKTVGMMKRKGWVDTVDGKFGTEVEFTSKGRKVWSQYQDDWEDFIG